MDRIKLITLSVLLMSLYACKPSDVDGLVPGDFTYYIYNSTERTVRINCYPESSSWNDEEFEIRANDSVRIKGKVDAFEFYPVPFPMGEVYVTFDDTIKYKCVDNPAGRCMLNRYFMYTSKEVIKDVLYKRDYYITEEDYEYAKDHPYVGEEE